VSLVIEPTTLSVVIAPRPTLVVTLAPEKPLVVTLLQGPPGKDSVVPGPASTVPGPSAYQVAVANGFVGDEAAWLVSLHGADSTVPGPASTVPGPSAYQIAVTNGFVGDEAAWLASLHGAAGASTAVGVSVDASGFNGNLATTDVNLQLVAQKVDDLSIPALPAIATGAEVTTGTDNVKQVTPKALSDAGIGIFDVLSPLRATEISIVAATLATISRQHVCSGTTADYAAMLPSVAGNTGKFAGFRMSPGLTKLVTLTTGADAVAKTGTVTGGTGSNLPGIGTVATSGSSATLTGSSTVFTTQLRVGDVLSFPSIGTRRVIAIAGNTSLTLDAVATITSTAFAFTQNGILGSGTQLSTDYTVGNGITVGSVTRTITYVLSATVVAIDCPFTSAPAGAAHGLTTVTIDGQYNRVMWASEAATLYCDGSSWAKVAGKSIPMRCWLYLSADVNTGIDSVWTKVSLDTNSVDSVGMSDITNKRINIKRGGFYVLDASAWTPTSGITYTRYIAAGYKNGVALYSAEAPPIGVYVIATTPPFQINVAAGDYIELWNCIMFSAGTPKSGGGLAYKSRLGLVEVCNW
jgi:hypothetical protein